MTDAADHLVQHLRGTLPAATFTVHRNGDGCLIQWPGTQGEEPALEQVRVPTPDQALTPVADFGQALLRYRPQSAAVARHVVRTMLLLWKLYDLVEAGELVVSELAGNATKTGCRRHMTVTVERVTDRCVRISVRDGSRTLPCLIEADPTAETGRGLDLVHQLTGGQWGATLESFGKTVHADLSTDSPGPA